VAISEHTEIVAVGTTTSFLQWTPVFAGALVAAAASLVLIAFGTAIGLAVVSSSPTWRDTSPALTMVSGLYLLLSALVSFGLGGYVAGRLRERWDPSVHTAVGRVPGRHSRNCSLGSCRRTHWSRCRGVCGQSRIQDSTADYFFGDNSRRASHCLRTRPAVPR
jgi:hypothetical protein